jgi:hypothetical protein
VQIAFTDGIVNPNYYFPLAAFTVNGTYSTVFYQGANTGILKVTVVPEPASGFLVMGPLATLLIRAHRKARKRDRLVVARYFSEKNPETPLHNPAIVVDKSPYHSLAVTMAKSANLRYRL